MRLKGHAPCCYHYPWWRIGELVSQDRRFDLVTSNANLLEFNPAALDDYLTLIQRVLSPAGALVVQCTGFPAQGTDEQLLDKMHAKGFAPLFFVQQNKPIKNPLEQAALSAGTLNSVQFDVTNALFVRSGHPLFARYHQSPAVGCTSPRQSPWSAASTSNVHRNGAFRRLRSSWRIRNERCLRDWRVGCADDFRC